MPAIENYVRQWSEHSGIEAEFLNSTLKTMRLTPNIETNFYRIVQETLHNIYKHAEAKNVTVMLETRDDLIVLIVEDDGKGFNHKDEKNLSKGLGLTGMKERRADGRNARNRIGGGRRHDRFRPHSGFSYEEGSG